jgi:hypothetical protein
MKVTLPAGAPSRTSRATPAAKTGPSTLDLLSAAAAEPAQALPGKLRRGLRDRLAADFSSVRIHAGAASAAAAEGFGARAYTLGHRIHLGAGASSLAGSERDRLLVHEAIHAAQQGFRQVMPHSGLRMGRRESAAEAEARSIAAQLSAPAASDSPELRDRLRQAVPVQQRIEPHIQCDLGLKDSFEAIDGTFNVNMEAQGNPGGFSGLDGTIKFKASDKAPDSPRIRLLQIARLEDLTTGKEFEWTGDEANRMKVMTAEGRDVSRGEVHKEGSRGTIKTPAERSVAPGYFVDVRYAGRKPRTAKSDAPVSPYYNDTSIGEPAKRARADGSKKGKDIKEASLRDFPGSRRNTRFSLETAAVAPASGYVYATLTWGFTIKDAKNGFVDEEHAEVNDFPTATFNAALKKFNEFYKNPGTSKAPQ